MSPDPPSRTRPRSRSHSPPPHHQNQQRETERERRPSPLYESYHTITSRRAESTRQEETQRSNERQSLRQEREERDTERERRGVVREEERGRRTPERELGNGRGYGGGDRGGYQGGNQGGYQGGGRNGGGGGGGGDAYFEARRRERDASHITIWPASPKAPRATSPSSKHSKHDKKSSSSSSRHKSSSSRRRSRRSPSTSDSSDDSSEEERRRDRKKKRGSSSSSSRHESSGSGRKSSSSRTKDPSSREGRVERIVEEVPGELNLIEEEDEEDEEDAWVEKEQVMADEGEEEVGPLPLFIPGQKGGRNAYGGALLKGEGSAMAAFVAEGERIPRRGEIGMESEEIERFEQIGYVMSGSRHRRMNAVRVRKENQVISAEEKRGILQLQKAEKEKRENMIVSSFKELVDGSLNKGR